MERRNIATTKKSLIKPNRFKQFYLWLPISEFVKVYIYHFITFEKIMEIHHDEFKEEKKVLGFSKALRFSLGFT